MLDLNLKEVGVRWRDDGDSRYEPIRGSIRNARELLKIRGMKYDLAGAISDDEAPSNDAVGTPEIARKDVAPRTAA